MHQKSTPSIPQFLPDHCFILYSIYFFCFHATAKAPQFFTVLCAAVRAKVTCLAIDCILQDWFPYEIGSSTSLWQHGQVQHFMLPAAVFSTFLRTHSLRTVPKQDGIDGSLKTSFKLPIWQESDSKQVFPMGSLERKVMFHFCFALPQDIFCYICLISTVHL